MADIPRCAICGTPLRAPDEPCPACLVRLGFATDGSETRLTPAPTGDAADQTRLTADPQRSATEVHTSASTSHPGTIGPYRVVRVLGEGGMGTVYLAEQTQPLKRTVALKVIKLGMDTQDVVARFEAERQTLALMDHPNIASVFDAGATPDGRPYFVMEYVAGAPITEYCDAERLPMRRRLELFTHVCAAVQHAHQKGVIHRDLKPSNVLVTIVDGRPVPKVIDFGIAKATEQRAAERANFTQLGVLVGTPEYMSPEQTDPGATDIDTRTDVYSLGAILYELLTGVVPFSSTRLREAGYSEMIRIIREEEPARPSTRVTEEGDPATVAERRRTRPATLTQQLRGDLDWITLRALEKNRARRYPTVTDLAADIDRFLNHEPVSARPPSVNYRVQKFVRRNRLAVTAVALIAAAVLAGLVVSTSLYFSADRARRDAETQRVEADRQRAEATVERQKADDNARQADANAQRADTQRDRADALRIEADRQRERAVSESYAANIKLAKADIDRAGNSGNVGSMRLLDTAVEKRNWEWGYLAAKLDPSRWRVPIPTFTRGPLAFSADGRQVLAATDRLLLAWNLEHGDRTLFASDPDPISSVDRLARRLVRVRDRTVPRIIDAVSARQIAELPASDTPILATQLSPDLTILASVDREGGVRFQQVAGGRVIGTAKGPAGRLKQVEFSPDGRSLLLRSSTTAVLIATDPPFLTRDLPAAADSDAMAFHADGRSVWFAVDNGPLRRLDVTTGRELASFALGIGSISQIAVSANGQTLAVGGTTGARLVDVSTGLSTVLWVGSKPHALALAFSKDDQTVVCLDDTDELVAFDVVRLRLAQGIQFGEARKPLALSPSGKRAVALTGDRLSVRNMDDGGVRTLTLPPGTAPALVALAVSDAGQVAAVTREGSALFWTATEIQPRIIADPASRTAAVALSLDGRLLAAGGNGQVHVWNTSSMQVQFTGPLPTRNDSSRHTLRFDPTDRYLAAFWDTDDKVLSEKLLVWDLSSRSLTWSHDFKLLESVTFTADGSRALLWGGLRLDARSLHAGGPLFSAQTLWLTATDAAVSPDGRRLAVASGNLIQILDAQTGKTLVEFSEKNTGVEALRLTRDGRRLVVAFTDGVIQVLDASWNVSVITGALGDKPTEKMEKGDTASLFRDLEITPADKEAALAELTRRQDRDPAARLNSTSWAIVRDAHQSAARYRDAIDAARGASALVPWSPEYIGMRGIGEYRAGQLGAALTTLNQSVDAWSSRGAAWIGPVSLAVAIDALRPDYEPGDAAPFGLNYTFGANDRLVFTGPFKEILASAGIVRAFRSMCLQKLGRTAEARADVEWVRVASRTEAQQIRVAGRKSWNNATIAAFLDEADRMVAGAEARNERSPEAHQQAWARVGKLFQDPALFADDVIERIEADRSLPAVVREAALRTAHAMGDAPFELNAASWKVALKPNAASEDYRIAVRRAEKAAGMVPKGAEYLNTLALALVRAGRSQDALEAIGRAVALRPKKTPPKEGFINLDDYDRNSDTVIAVLARLGLGQLDSVRADLDTLARSDSLGADTRTLMTEARDIEIRVADTKAGVNRDAAVYQRARTLVNTLSAAPATFSDDVAKRVEADRSLPADVRDVAVRMANALIDDPVRLNTASWGVVKVPGGTAEIYRIALQRAQKVTDLAPNAPGWLNTLALAQYRAGLYREALATTIRVAALRPPTTEDRLVSALIRLRLGQLDSASTDLDALAKVTNRSADQTALLKEAQVLLDELRKKLDRVVDNAARWLRPLTAGA